MLFVDYFNTGLFIIFNYSSDSIAFVTNTEKQKLYVNIK